MTGLQVRTGNATDERMPWGKRMRKPGDFGDIIIEEVLADTANDFFGKRKIIENQVDMLQTYVKKLSKKSFSISKHLSLLGYLLLERTNTNAFFKQIGTVDCEILLKGKQPYFDLLPQKAKLGVGSKKKFYRLIFYLYKQIQTLCDAYNRGQIYGDATGQDSVEKDPEVNFQFIMNMVNLINENIRKVNVEKSPSSVLQFAKSFNSDAAQKEKITGAMSADYNQHLNQKMRIDLINPEKLEMDKYPLLPAPEAVKVKIKEYCRLFYKNNKDEVRQMLRELNMFQTNGRQNR